MSCNTLCGPLVVTLLTGVPGLQGPQGPEGPQGPPGSLTSVTGDLSLTTSGGGTVATVTGIRGKTVSATAPTANQIYQYNGTSWVPVDFTAGTY